MLRHTMARNARIPKVDLTDPRLHEVARLMDKIADKRSGPLANFEARSAALEAIALEAMSLLTQQRGARKNSVDD